MIEYVIKRDGREEPFNPDKLNNWGVWACKTIDPKVVNWSSVVLKTVSTLPSKISTDDLQKALIKNCLDYDTYEHNRMAGRLYAISLPKQLYNDRKHPHIKDLHQEMVNIGLLAPELGYTDEEYEAVNKMINHKRDISSTYYALHHIITKYAKKDHITGKIYETPQFVYMRVAMQTFKNIRTVNRLEMLEKLYGFLSNRKINIPTPYMSNSLTTNPNVASCSVVTIKDEAQSIGLGSILAYSLTTSGAGLGLHMKTRSIGDAVRGGDIEHQGKVPYYRGIAHTIKSSKQGVRGGAGTMYFTFFDPEIITLLNLKNPLAVESKRLRELDYALLINKWFVRKALKKEDVYLFSYKNNPELYELFYDKDPDAFGKAMEEFAREHPTKVEKINASEILSVCLRQSVETGRVYLMFADEANRRSPYKETIYSSNLCVHGDTRIRTKEYGDTPIKDIEGQTVSIWNGSIINDQIQHPDKNKEPLWSPVTVVKTGENQELVRVKVRRYVGGFYEETVTIDCTPYHKFHMLDINTMETVVKEAKDLKENERSIPYYASIEDLVLDHFEVVSVEPVEHLHDTYCVNEPLNNTVIFNGILTGNCTEILLPTKPYTKIEDLSSTNPDDGLVAFCNLAGIVVDNIDSEEEYEEACYYALLMIDEGINNASLPYESLNHSIRYYRSAGVGILGLAHLMAKNKLSYKTKEGRDFIFSLGEKHAYYLYKAALRLGKERGNAPCMERTLFPEGWLPIDVMNPNLSDLCDTTLKYDWEELRKQIIENKGIRFSTVSTIPPSENSSISCSTTNGPYPIRSLSITKTSGNTATKWVAPEATKYKNRYDIAWEMSNEEHIYVYSILQAFIDQTISADFYVDRRGNKEISMAQMFKEVALMAKYGQITRYYYNSLIEDEKAVEFTKVTQEEPEEDNSSAEESCGSGGCTL